MHSLADTLYDCDWHWETKTSKKGTSYDVIKRKDKFTMQDFHFAWDSNSLNRNLQLYGYILWPTKRGVIIKQIWCAPIPLKKRKTDILKYRIIRSGQLRKTKDDKYQAIHFVNDKDHYFFKGRERVLSTTANTINSSILERIAETITANVNIRIDEIVLQAIKTYTHKRIREVENA